MAFHFFQTVSEMPSHSQGADFLSPCLREESPLGRKRRPQSIEGSWKGRANGITYRLEDETAVSLYGFPDDGVVAG